MQATNSGTQSHSKPWYRQFWPWFVFGLLGWGVVSSSIVLTMAINNPPHMMTGDYARLGKALVDTHVRADRAEAMGLSGRMQAADGRWRLDLKAEDSLPDESLLLLVQHPTDSARDRQVVLARTGPDQYRAEAARPGPRGRLIVSDLAQTWWISSTYAGSGGDVDVELVPERL